MNTDQWREIANETLELMDRRSSVRHFEPRSIDPKHIDAILHAAMRAPTAGNMMRYSILEVSDPGKKMQLSETCGHAFVGDAPLVLLFLADMQRWYDFFAAFGVPSYCKQHGKPFITPKMSDLLMGCCDALIAAQNSVIAAESLCIGSCYIGDILGECEAHRAMFGLPQWAFPVTLVCYGYRAEDTPRQRSTRFAKEFICFRDTYKHLSRNDFSAMFADIEAKFAGILEERNLSLAQLTVQGLTLGEAATEQRRSVAKLLEIWLG